jgi:GNAT superfamily N-acetyltransferase
MPNAVAVAAATVLARDGTLVRLRPLRREERDLVAGFFAGLSEESRRRRFLGPMSRLPEAMLRHLVEVDGHRHVAVVAEVALTVTDRFQGRGIGRLLLGALAATAGGAGVGALVYLVDPGNRPMLGLLRSMGVELRFRDGLVQGRQPLARPRAPRMA